MKYLAGLLFAFLLHTNVGATVLCDASCELAITFPAGGSITADEGMLITFGSGGILNLGAAGTINTNPQPLGSDYSSGGQLLLAKGDSINFDVDGLLLLGDGGNIYYTAITVSSSGAASLSAVDNSESIVIDNLTISGGLNITFVAKNISVTGELIISSGSTLNLIADTDEPGTSVCSIQDPSGVVLTSGSGSIDTTDSCNTISSDLSLSTDVVNIGVIDPNATLVLDSSAITLTPVIELGDLTIDLKTLTQELLSSLPDDIELPTDDGNTCTMVSGECVTATGVKYVVVSGKLVPAATTNAASDGAGEVSVTSVIVMLFFLLFFRLYFKV